MAQDLNELLQSILQSPSGQNTLMQVGMQPSQTPARPMLPTGGPAMPTMPQTPQINPAPMIEKAVQNRMLPPTQPSGGGDLGALMDPTIINPPRPPATQPALTGGTMQGTAPTPGGATGGVEQGTAPQPDQSRRARMMAALRGASQSAIEPPPPVAPAAPRAVPQTNLTLQALLGSLMNPRPYK